MWHDLSHDKPTLIVFAKPYSNPGHSLRLTVSKSYRSDERSPLSRIKQTGILWKILPRADAVRSGFDDALLMNTAGDISESTSANTFWVRDEVLYTPSLECGILPGVTRSIVVQIAREAGIEVIEDRFPLDHLLGADEAFLTSSTAELAPVRSIEETVFPSDAPGPMTRRVMELFRDHVRSVLGL